MIAGVQSAGVCYGMMGNNLPSAGDVISLYKSHNIGRMRLYDPNQSALQALKGSNIEVIIGVPNTDLQYLSNPSNARTWVQNNIRNYWPNVRFRYVAVGNEISPINTATSRYAQFVLAAIWNVQNALVSFGLGSIKVSTSIDMTLIGNSYPPSQGSFRNDIRSYLDPIINFMVQTKSPLLANIYPYFSYSGNPKDISLQYALFTSPGVVIWDSGRGYQNLFDAMIDALYSAMERIGGGSVEVVVSETGWPSAGGFGTSMDNARIYYTNVLKHVKNGSPKKPNKAIETYLFAMFDENNKWPELEKHFGVFYPNRQAKYPLNFNGMEMVINEAAEFFNSTMMLSDI